MITIIMWAMLTEYRFKKIIEKVIKESLSAVRLGDIAKAVVQSVGNGRAISPEGRDIFELMEVGESSVDVEFFYTTYIYKTKEKEYGYYDLPDESEIIEERAPEIDGVDIIIDGNHVEDDGTVTNTLQTLFDNGRLYVDKSDSSAFLSQREYFGENKTYNNNTNMNKKQVIKLTESDLHKIVKESVNKVLNEGLWDAIERDKYQVYDMFVDFIKDYYAPNDNNKAYEIEDYVNDWMTRMIEDLDSKYGSI